MRNQVAQLFDEFVAQFRAGEKPDLRDYLDRVGPDRAELARLVDGFLRWAEPPDPDEDAVLLAQAWIEGEAPMLALRVRRGIRRDDVVDTLVGRFGLAGLREKVARRYHELETGLLDAKQADPALLNELAALFKARASDFVAWKPRPMQAKQAYFRSNAALTDQSIPAPAAKAEDPDEVDRLFLGTD